MEQSIEETAAALAGGGKGILAADESTGTMEKRLASIGVGSTAEARRDWRELLFGCEDALRECISGVILFDETLRQKTADGRARLVDLIERAGSMAGIKVDAGAKPMALHEGETITEGLDGLRDRLEDYRSLGARFAKWRAVLRIGKGLPTKACVRANAEALARYAALCQEAGLVPIVEPEVLMEGSHDAARCGEATGFVLKEVYDSLALHGVKLEGTLLKPNMIVSGVGCAEQAGVDEVAERTLKCLCSGVPKAVAGVAFLSGGQSDEAASAHLSAMNALGGAFWPLTFSYGRALQAGALSCWRGQAENKSAAQQVFAHRARMNRLACEGRWSAEAESRAA